MATYDDEVNAAYWAGFLKQNPGSPGSAPYQRDDIGPVPPDTVLPQRAVAELQRQLRLIHGPSAEIGEPTMALFADSETRSLRWRLAFLEHRRAALGRRATNP